LRRIRNEILHGLRGFETEELVLGFQSATDILDQLKQDPRIDAILQEEAARNRTQPKAAKRPVSKKRSKTQSGPK
jgi:hypothetical protein